MRGVLLFVGVPSQSRLAPCQRLGCRLGRPLGNVPPGRSGPRRGSQVGAPPKACAKPSLASPFGGRWCPVGTVQRLVSAAASVGDGRSPLGCITRAGRRECPPRKGGEGKPLARSPASGTPPSRCAAVREKRFAVSLAFSHALRAYKGKAVGLWSHLPVRSAQGVCHRQTAPYNPQLLKKLAKLLRSLRSASCAHVRYPLDEHERQRAAKGAN